MDLNYMIVFCHFGDFKMLEISSIIGQSWNCLDFNSIS